MEIQRTLVNEFESRMESTSQRATAVNQFDNLKPTIITVMNEAFTDLTIYQELVDAGYQGPQAYKSLTDTLIRGPLDVSVTGGGTANSEFEFPTGFSSAFIGGAKCPYQLYDLENIDSIVEQFTTLGYSATALHPENPMNYNRSTVYPKLGFDSFLSKEDFEDAELYHIWVSDKSTYDKVLDLLRPDTTDQFIFDFTIQNHSGYENGTVPIEDVVSYIPSGIADEEVLSQLNNYLACVKNLTRRLPTS